MSIINSRDLVNQNRCKVLRKHNIPVKKGNIQGFMYSSVVIGIIQDFYSGKYNSTVDLKHDLEDRINAIGYHKGQKEMKINDAFCFIQRYLNSQHTISEATRIPVIPITGTVSIDPVIDVQVTPSLMFLNEGNIEVIKLKTGASKNTNIGKLKILKQGGLELYAMAKYAEEYYRMQYGKYPLSVTAAYHFLRKNSDVLSNDLAKCKFDPDFFTHENIRTGELKSTYGDNFFAVKGTGDGSSSCLTTLEKNYKPYIEDYKQGDDIEASRECSNCESCQYNEVCNYEKAPIVEVKERKIRSLSDLELTSAQEEVVELDQGIIRVNAGPGAGKTLVLTLRVVTLLNKGVKPSEILLFTFTNTGAEEMRERIALYNDDFGSGEDISDMVISTFNAFGDTVLKKEYAKFGFKKEPNVIDDVQRSIIIARLINSVDLIEGLDYRNFSQDMMFCKGALATVKDLFMLIKIHQYTDADVDALANEYFGVDISTGKTVTVSPETKDMTRKIMALYSQYDNELRSNNLIEFADQELMLKQLLADDPYYFDSMGIKHIIVDEFQDTSEEEMDILKYFLKAPSFESFMVVGDDSQSIFGFRNTSPEYLINFFNIFQCDEADRKDIYLLENHRSTPEIIDFANKLNDINKNKVDKQLIATRKHGVKPEVHGFETKADEYEYLADRIANTWTSGERSVAYIAQSKSELLTMADMLTERGIPSILMNPEQLIGNSRVRAALSLAAVFNDINDTANILVCVNAMYKGALFDLSDDEIKQEIKKLQDMVSMIRQMPDIVKKPQFIQLLKKFDEDDEVFQSFCDSLSHQPSFKQMLEYCSCFNEYGANTAVRRVRDYPGVVLTTAHSSKGLEWDHVFCSVSKFHSKKLAFNSKSDKDIKVCEEARRLFFVTVTRARDELVITGQYIAYGGLWKPVYNQFLIESCDILGVPFEGKELVALRQAEKREEQKAKRAS